MAMTAVAHGQVRDANAVYTYFDKSPVLGARVGDEFYLPVDSASRLGWQVNVQSGSAQVNAEGMSFVIGVTTVRGKTSLPLKAALAKISGSAEWLPNTDTLQVVSDLSSIQCQSGRIKVSGPLQIKPKAFALTGPDRLVLDFVGARISNKTVQSTDGGVRVTQYKPNVVRIVMQTDGAPDLSKISTDPTKSTTIELATAADTSAPVPVSGVPISEPPAKVEEKGQQGDAVSDGAVKVATPVVDAPKYLPLTLVSETPKVAQFSIAIHGLKANAQSHKTDPSTLEILIPGVSADLPPDFQLHSDAVSLCRTEQTSAGTKLTMYLNRPAGAEVYTDASGISIQLLRPNVGDGRLSGKVIVVDPGHGGNDPGAHEAGYQEKVLTLQIGKYLASFLAEEGATVILTRKTDTFIPLTTRADIANQNHADLFISCHINDSGGSHNMAGTITFHHKGNEISRILAECIEHEIGKVSGIPATGVWSDGKIYPTSGFSVLRNTKMTGVLIEFGFIDNPQDRKRLITDQFQQAAAKAVVQGIKVYLGDAKAK